MTDIFDFEPRVDDYAVMGNPIKHSKSPQIHSLFASQTNQSIKYTAIQVDTGGFKQAVGNFAAHKGKGLNITVPFKEEAWALVDERSERAERAGAINTIKLIDGKLFGDNTDGIGLVNDLKNNYKIELSGKRILVMGAGGAARGVLAPLLSEKPKNIVIVNRTQSKAKDLAAHFNTLGSISGCGYEDLGYGNLTNGDLTNDNLNEQQFDIIINATAASLQGELPPLPDNLVAIGGCCYDMMYGQITPFMQWAKAQGVTVIADGLGMLVEQAAESFYIWRGVRPDTLPVLEQLKKEIY